MRTIKGPAFFLALFAGDEAPFSSLDSIAQWVESHYVLQALDYLDHIDIYHERIKIFYVKDAKLNPTGRQGVYCAYQGWVDRAAAATRTPAGYPEGYLEGFATLYKEIATAIRVARSGTTSTGLFPRGEDGRKGIAFVEAAVKSSNEGSVWVNL